MEDRGRRVTTLTIPQKADLIERLRKGEAPAKLVKEFGIAKSTLYNIKRDSEKILRFAAYRESPAWRMRVKKSSLSHMEEELYKWFSQLQALGVSVNGPMLCEKAGQLHRQLEIKEPFVANFEWLVKFKNSHNIRLLHDPEPHVSEDYVGQFAKIASEKNLTPDQMYNCGISELFWKHFPAERFADSENKLMFLVCANGSGTHKLPMTVVGRQENLSGLENTPVDYFSHKKGLLDLVIFRLWFEERFVPAVREHLHRKNLPQRAILLFDDTLFNSGNVPLESCDGSFSAIVIPSSVACDLLPMYQGVIENIKRRYRWKLLKRVGQDLKGFWDHYRIEDAAFDISLSWERTEQAILERSWLKLTGKKEYLLSGNGIPISSYLVKLKSLKACTGITEDDIKKWLMDDVGKVQQTKSWAGSRNNTKKTDSSGNGCEELVTSSDALAAAQTVLDFMECSGNVEPVLYQKMKAVHSWISQVHNQVLDKKMEVELLHETFTN